MIGLYTEAARLRGAFAAFWSSWSLPCLPGPFFHPIETYALVLRPQKSSNLRLNPPCYFLTVVLNDLHAADALKNTGNCLSSDGHHSCHSNALHITDDITIGAKRVIE